MGSVQTPEWFKPEKYADAEGLDLGDWLLNLTVRCWLQRETDTMLESVMRQRHPVLRRNEDREVLSQVLAISHAPQDVREALEFGRVGSGINPVRVKELYTFEQKLPEDVRKAGAAYQRGPTTLTEVPDAFNGTLDDAFGHGERGNFGQMTGRFVRLDVTLPDDVLFADIRCFLEAERARLAAFGGPQEWRAASRIKAKSHDLATLANIGLLPYLDLDRWQKAKGLALTFEQVRQMAGCAKERSRELRKYADWAQRQMLLRAWFARLDRSAKVTPKKREA